MKQYLVLFTMKGCPFCDMLKNSLKEEKIFFVDRDINDYKDEYEMFIKSVGGNEFVPAFMIIETDGKNAKSEFYAPERDFNTIEDGVKIIKENLIK